MEEEGRTTAAASRQRHKDSLTTLCPFVAVRRCIYVEVDEKSNEFTNYKQSSK
ncbi:hypothetical protein L195_g004091 [Trifolium pratense]|uniref:Uncharacterized protein n=1 Tax=Trifolium pratense TaxID=57577 RepID=A0A2K3KY12_TRIPR|nr:hypothetical protein L195_g027043 [Trifolium pratense]PNX76330.1 hypothetical protein L195_g032276 [Trifolium pratense]PNY07590.1 hypothetical protein L195_g004091 [Trifolium pratense]